MKKKITGMDATNCMEFEYGSLVFLYGLLYEYLYRKYRYMVWNHLFCVWFGFGNSQTHFLLGLS